MQTPNDLKVALASWASGVAVVGAEDAGALHGITVSSFTSLSLDPPLVLTCLANGARILEPLRRAGRFTVSVLSAEQEAVSRHFASRGRDPVDPHAPGPVPLVRTPDGQPRVADAAAWLACALEALLPQGDHHIVIGRVVAAGADESRAPLLYFRRAYRAVRTD